jgi:hypothetical protein
VADENDPKKTSAYKKQGAENDPPEADDVGQALRALSSQLGTFLDEIKTQRDTETSERQSDRYWQGLSTKIGIAISSLTLLVLIFTYFVYRKIGQTEITQATIMATQATIMQGQKEITEKTLPAMQAQATAAIMAAKNGEDANKNALEMFTENHQPSVGVGTPTGKVAEFVSGPDSQGKYWTRIFFYNSGNAPAYHFQINAWGKYYEEARRFVHIQRWYDETAKRFATDAGGATLLPGTSQSEVVLYGMPTAQEISVFNSGGEDFGVGGTFEFCDDAGKFHCEPFVVTYKGHDNWIVTNQGPSCYPLNLPTTPGVSGTLPGRDVPDKIVQVPQCEQPGEHYEQK